MVGTQILFIFFCNAAWTTASDLWCCHDVNYVSSEARNSRSNPGCAGRVPWRSWPCWPWWPWRSYWSCAWWTTAQFWAPRLWAGASQTKWPWWTWWTWWFLSTWSSRTHGTYASCRFPGIWADVRSDPTRTTQPCPSSSWATRSSITLGVWNAKWKRSFTFPATRAANWKTWNSTNKWWCWHWRGRCGQPSWSPWAMDGEGNWGKSLEIFRRDQLIFGIIYHVFFYGLYSVCFIGFVFCFKASITTCQLQIWGLLFGGFGCLLSCFLLIAILLLMDVRILDPRPNDIVPVILRELWLKSWTDIGYIGIWWHLHPTSGRIGQKCRVQMSRFQTTFMWTSVFSASL